MKKAVLLSLCIYPLALIAAPHEHIDHEAHVHGEAILHVVLEKNALAIELNSPAANIVGFEHQPKNKAQKKAVADAIQHLKKIGDLFLIPAAAQCKAEEVEVASSLAENQDDHHHRHGHEEHDHKDEHEEETHSEFTAHYHFHCDQPAQLNQIEMTIFKTFPGIENMDVQSVSQRGQQKQELTPANKVLTL